MSGFYNGIRTYPFYVQLCAPELTRPAVDVACIHITFYLIYPFETGSSSLQSERTHNNGSFFIYSAADCVWFTPQWLIGGEGAFSKQYKH